MLEGKMKRQIGERRWSEEIGGRKWGERKTEGNHSGK